mmetsp:Transcript_4766/g.11917  ORF Transcript_4766/g.11917 Transcript_4766/m.11917 type:complete len:264 (+) Transcript_4766:188-979(+)
MIRKSRPGTFVARHLARNNTFLVWNRGRPLVTVEHVGHVVGLGKVYDVAFARRVSSRMHPEVFWGSYYPSIVIGQSVALLLDEPSPIFFLRLQSFHQYIILFGDDVRFLFSLWFFTIRGRCPGSWRLRSRPPLDLVIDLGRIRFPFALHEARFHVQLVVAVVIQDVVGLVVVHGNHLPREPFRPAVPPCFYSIPNFVRPVRMFFRFFVGGVLLGEPCASSSGRGGALSSRRHRLAVSLPERLLLALWRVDGVQVVLARRTRCL